MSLVREALSIRISSLTSAGFTYIEVVVVIALIGSLLVIALTRLLPYISEAERIAVISLEAQIRSTLVMAAAERIASGNAASIGQLTGSNPMDLMLQAPSNYLGEMQEVDGAGIPERHWYFNADARRLVYRPGPRYTRDLEQQSSESIEFAVNVEYDDRDRNGVFAPGRDELHGVRLVRAAGNDWLNGGKTSVR